MVKKNRKKIVVLGGGFAGIRVVQDLAKGFSESTKFSREYEIVLVDQNSFHVFKADLYEVVAAFNKRISDECLTVLKETVATPIEKLIDKKFAKFIQDEILLVDPNKQIVTMKRSGKLHYDYLVVALGSVPNYFGISGLKEFSFIMQNVVDAIKLSCHLGHFFYQLWKSSSVRDVYITVGGGGATGIETVGELAFAMRKLALKYKYPLNKIHLQLVEGSKNLAGLSERGTDVVLKRLRKIGVEVYLNFFIKCLWKNKFSIKQRDGAEKFLKSDIFIWTGGVMVSPVVAQSLGDKKLGGAIEVNSFLQTKSFSNIFAAGDNAFFHDPKNGGRRVPMMAQFAFREGQTVAKNILKKIEHRLMCSFKISEAKLILPLGGKYAVFNIGDKIFKGFFPWLLKRLVSLRYALMILPFFVALKKWWHSNQVFVEND